jgi:hypothetical protein
MSSSRAIEIYFPSSWDDVYETRLAITSSAPIQVPNPAQWPVDLNSRIGEAERDVRILASATGGALDLQREEIQRVRAQYQLLANGM